MLDLVHKTYEWLGLVFQSPKISQFRLDRIIIPHLYKARKSLRGIFGNILKQRLELMTTQGDVYDVYLNARDPESGERWPIPELGAEALLLFGAGRSILLLFDSLAFLCQSPMLAETELMTRSGPDATSSSMSAVLFYIAHNPDVYEKVNEEIRSAFDSADDIVPGAVLNGCQYLRACIDEAQRRNPANGAALWREVDAGGTSIDREQFPAGVDVGVSIYAIHHNSTYFPDPFAFKPERWIVSKDNPEANVELARSAWNPFSLGPRGCVGKPVALVQLTLTLARLYWQFDIRVPQDPVLASLGCGKRGAKYGRHRPDEFQTMCSFQNSVDGPMLGFKDRTSKIEHQKL